MMDARAAAISRYKEQFSRPIDDVVKDLESYAALLQKWQSVQNLVSRETLGSIWDRHFADSLQVLSLFRPSDQLFFDLGSGGGFPALPLAIACKGTDRQFVLIEPTARKVSFLRAVARELDLAVTVIGSRSDQIDSRETPQPDVITSRALAALPQLCEWMLPFWCAKTRAILHKGREHGDEIAESRSDWQFDVVVRQSDLESSGVILEITNLSRGSGS